MKKYANKTLGIMIAAIIICLVAMIIQIAEIISSALQ
jgi:tetrahydromethanopterin S-methyltransferase subunit B